MSTSNHQELPSLTLYYAPDFCSLAVRIALHELGLPFSQVEMKLDPATMKLAAADGSLSADEYRARVHHMGLVPGLEIRSFSDSPATATSGNNNSATATATSVTTSSLTELPAILTYLVSLAGSPEKESSLMGGGGGGSGNGNDKTGALEKSKTLAWLIWLSGSLHGQGYGPYFVPSRWVVGGGEGEGAVVESVKEAAAKRIRACYESIESRLDEYGGYFQGGQEEPTVVDLAAYVFWRWGSKQGFGMEEKYPKYGRIMRRLEERASVRKALEEEGLQGVFFPGGKGVESVTN